MNAPTPPHDGLALSRSLLHPAYFSPTLAHLAAPQPVSMHSGPHHHSPSPPSPSPPRLSLFLPPLGPSGPFTLRTPLLPGPSPSRPTCRHHMPPHFMRTQTHCEAHKWDSHSCLHFRPAPPFSGGWIQISGRMLHPLPTRKICHAKMAKNLLEN